MKLPYLQAGFQTSKAFILRTNKTKDVKSTNREGRSLSYISLTLFFQRIGILKLTQIVGNTVVIWTYFSRIGLLFVEELHPMAS